MQRFMCFVIVCAFVTGAQAQDSGKKSNKPGATAHVAAKSVLDFSVKDIDGKDVDLKKYKGKVVLMVNVASKCGFTPQYEQLEALHAEYAETGLAVLGFPANNFRHQEPGTNAEIKAFCKSTFNVKFDMFSKVSVKGDDCCDLYKFLTGKKTNKKFAGEIPWNFTKFLVNRKGEVVGRFGPRTRPDAPEVIKAIETELKK